MSEPTALMREARVPPPAAPPLAQDMADDDRHRKALVWVLGQIRAAGQALLAAVRKG